MYALIQNNQIKVGPRDYNPGFFNQFFENNNINFEAPVSYDSQESIVIDNDTKIVFVNDLVNPVYDPLTEQLAGPFWDTSTTPVTGEYQVADRSLDAIKNDLKAKVSEIRYNKESSGITVEIQNTPVALDTTRDSRHIWFQSLLLLPDNSTQNFKFNNQQWLELSKADIQTIVQAIVDHVQSAFDWEAAKVIEIDTADTKQKLKDIVLE
jgi:hypothetical protein